MQLRAYPLDSPLVLSTLGSTLQSYLEISSVDEEVRPYLVPDRILAKYCRILDIRQKSDKSSCCFTKAYSHYTEGTGSVLQSNEHESLSDRFARFEETNDIAELRPLGLRYFTPREVANLMAFPVSFSFPPSVSLKTRYRLLGNSLNVLIVTNLLNILLLN